MNDCCYNCPCNTTGRMHWLVESRGDSRVDIPPPGTPCPQGSPWGSGAPPGGGFCYRWQNSTSFEFVPGRWESWVYHTKLAFDSTGFVELWKNGVKVVDWHGVGTAFNDQPSLGGSGPYMKLGIYKWGWAARHIGTEQASAGSYDVHDSKIVYSEIRVGNASSSYDEVETSTKRLFEAAKTDDTPETARCPSNVTMFEKGNFAGGDIGSFELSEANASMCASACCAKPSCAGYTYVRPSLDAAHKGKPWCWLKGWPLPPEPGHSPCCASGIVRAPPPPRGPPHAKPVLTRVRTIASNPNGGLRDPSPALQDKSGTWHYWVVFAPPGNIAGCANTIWNGWLHHYSSSSGLNGSWISHGVALNRSADPTAFDHCGMMSPGAIYDARDDFWYLFFTGVGRNFTTSMVTAQTVARSRTPFGPWQRLGLVAWPTGEAPGWDSSWNARRLDSGRPLSIGGRRSYFTKGVSGASYKHAFGAYGVYHPSDASSFAPPYTPWRGNPIFNDTSLIPGSNAGYENCEFFSGPDGFLHVLCQNHGTGQPHFLTSAKNFGQRWDFLEDLDTSPALEPTPAYVGVPGDAAQVTHFIARQDEGGSTTIGLYSLSWEYSGTKTASKSDDPAPRRVSWYAKAGTGFGDRAASGEGNNSEWLAANRRAITALQPSYGCFEIADDGAFSLNTPPPHPRMLDSSGRSLCGPPYFSPTMGGPGPPVDIVPGGGISAAALRSGSWRRQNAVEAAVNATLVHGWAGLEVDDEFCCDGDGLTEAEIENWLDFVGNLSAALSRVGKRLQVDVNSYPWMDLSGPSHIAALAGLGKRHSLAHPPLLMDMSTYWAPGAAGPHSHVRNVTGLLRLGVPLEQVSLGIGLVEDVGHENASCTSCRGHTPSVPCPQIKSGECGNCSGCFNYGWTEASLRAFVGAAQAAGIRSLDIYRQDLISAAGTRTKIPPWFVSIMAEFLDAPSRPLKVGKTDDSSPTDSDDLVANPMLPFHVDYSYTNMTEAPAYDPDKAPYLPTQGRRLGPPHPPLIPPLAGCAMDA